MLNKNEEQLDETRSEKTLASTPNIIYQGSVKVTLKKGNKIIYSKSYHNNGGSPLFNFLTGCLAGRYQENDRPKNIRFFYASEDSSPGPITNSSTPCSPFIALNKVGLTEDSQGVVLHFTVPCAFVKTTGSNGKVNQIGLYSNAYTQSDNQQENYSAYWNLVDDNGNWDPMTVSSDNGDYNIFVEWTLSFTNKNSDVSVQN